MFLPLRLESSHEAVWGAMALQRAVAFLFLSQLGAVPSLPIEFRVLYFAVVQSR
ncbi:MAG: hypothetical protein ACI8PG_002131 [Planctomycetota bacterium]|jgi:hypothetical protein